MGIDVPIESVEDYLKNEGNPAPANKRLTGSISYTPEMAATDAQNARDVFPQPGENPVSAGLKKAVFPIQAAANGLESVPEDLANFAGGLAQQNTPHEYRKTYADIIRKMFPGYVSPGEVGRGPAFQAALAQHPDMSAQWGPMNFGGGFLFPLGGVENAAIKPVGKFVQGNVPMLQIGEQLQQISRNLPEMMRIAKYAPKVSPTLHGGISGAMYAPAFAGGQRFGESRELSTGGEMGQQAGLGALMGIGIAHGLNQLQKLLFMNQLKRMVGSSQLPNLPQAAPAAGREAIPAAPAMKSRLQAITYKNLGRDTTRGGAPRSEQQKAAVQKRIFDYAQKRAAPESDEHEQAIADAIRDYEKELYGRGRVQERRQYSEQQRDERTGQELGRRDAQYDRTARHTDTSANHFLQLTDHIDHAESPDELRAIENTIFTPGHGPEGKRLLDSSQQRKLERRIYERLHELRGEDAAGESRRPPGGSPGGRGGGEPQRPPQNNPSSQPAGEPSSPAPRAPLEDAAATTKTASPAAPSEAPHMVPEKPPQNPGTPKSAEMAAESPQEATKQFLKGAFRKTIDLKSYGNRESRYKFAVSPDALGQAAGLPREKITALEKWVASASEMRRELTYKQQELEKLVEWAFKNEHLWSAPESAVKVAKKGEDELLLSHAERQGRFRTLALRSKMERHFERETETNLERVKMNLQRYGYERAGAEAETVLKTDPRPNISTTLNGRVEKGAWQENHDGALKLLDKIIPLKEPKFNEPANAEELFDEAERVKRWISRFEYDLHDVYNAVGEHNYLGDGTKPVDVMNEAFEKLRDDMASPGETPVVHLWHVDKSSHVSTVRFDQRKTRESWPEHMSDLERLFKVIQRKTLENKGKDGKVDYEAVWSNPSVARVLTGVEPVMLAPLLAKYVHELASGVAKTTLAKHLYVGAIDDILRSNARFGGDEVSHMFHNMMGEISASFFNDRAGMLQPVKNAEELSELLNEFKGVTVTRSNYLKAARDAAIKEGKTTGGEVAEAERRGATAFMIRRKYQALAKKIEPRLEEMEVRRNDSATGVPSPEGRKFYTDADLHDDGKVRVTAYDQLYHEALRELHNGLLLQGKAASGFAELLGSISRRKMVSIFANNIPVATKNLFDQMPITLTYFHRHFLTAMTDLHGETASAIDRLPIIPASDTHLTRLEETLKNVNDRPAEGPFHAAKRFVERLDYNMQKKLDPIFKGHSVLVSLADKNYTRISVLASMHKIAAREGIERKQFVRNLLDGKYAKELAPDGETKEQKIWQEVSRDQNKLYNSLAPHLNKDLLASNTNGLISLITPGRRSFRVMWDLLRSDDMLDKLKASAMFAGLVALGGSGAIPQTAQYALRAVGAATGANAAVQQFQDNFDQMNLLRLATGIDYSSNFGPDVITNARPAIDALMKAGPDAQKALANRDYAGIVLATALEGLSVLPRQGPFGFDVWRKGFKAVQGAEAGTRKVYFEAGGQLKSINIPYDYSDALRDFMFGGTNPKAFEREHQIRMNAARKADAKFHRKDIIPSSSSAANQNQKSVFPTRSEI